MEYRSDAYYIEQVLQGDRQAYTRLVDKHKHMVFTVALRSWTDRPAGSRSSWGGAPGRVLPGQLGFALRDQDALLVVVEEEEEETR